MHTYYYHFDLNLYQVEINVSHPYSQITLNKVGSGQVDMGQVTKVGLSCYMVLLSFNSKTRKQDRRTFVIWLIFRFYGFCRILYTKVAVIGAGIAHSDLCDVHDDKFIKRRTWNDSNVNFINKISLIPEAVLKNINVAPQTQAVRAFYYEWSWCLGFKFRLVWDTLCLKNVSMLMHLYACRSVLIISGPLCAITVDVFFKRSDLARLVFIPRAQNNDASL